MSEGFRTIQVTKSILREALKDNLYWKNTKVVPFSKNKAHWLLQNTRIEENDLCAVLGYENDELVSFVYMVPDWLKTEQGNKKIYWCRRWWIIDKYRDSVLPTYTMNEAVLATNNQVIIKYLGREVVEFYKKQPYANFSPRTRYIILFSLNVDLLVSKVNRLASFRVFLKPLESISLSFINTLNNFKIKRNIKDLKCNYSSIINDSIWDFISETCKKDIIPKSKEYINWQLSEEQYTQTSKLNELPYSCLIASISNNIYPKTFSIYKENKIIGFVSFLVRSKEFEIKYFIASDKYFDKCLDVLMDHFIKADTDTLLTENDTLGKHIQERYYSVYTNKRELNALAHRDINFDFTNLKIYDRDGHFA